ncbi:NmrA-like family protein [Penicillium chermesinum]|uniref:NmrA-like family protein n=1 Tax=Penicillium chermesinum TaxID=63820 RepID=A0A9W9NX43_9EURO|nr:NmrA-like family protein [Penicillium chermesinum]KAJ5226269.1 NmrA-like family protein [Penicillium chermesinum]
MSSFQVSKIFMIGGTGAQGLPIVRELVKDRRYDVRILTRNPNSRRAKELAELPGVELLQGTFASEDDLTSGFTGCDGAFVNIDGFNCGEKSELFWGIRAYEIALSVGVKFYVWGNLDYGLKKADWDPKYRCGHYDGKGRVGEWILQHATPHMGAALFTTGPYIDMALSPLTIMTPRLIDGVLTWSLPLGDGEVAHVALSDCGVYVRWLFDNPGRANGMDLEVAIAHISYSEMATAFEKVTGRPARYVDVPFGEYFKAFSGHESFMSVLKNPHMGLMSKLRFGFGFSTKQPSSYNADPADPATLSFETNFIGFWNLWRASKGNKGVMRRDYELLDEIHPNRIKSAEEWFRKEAEQGDLWERVSKMAPILKWSEDGAKGTI